MQTSHLSAAVLAVVLLVLGCGGTGPSPDTPSPDATPLPERAPTAPQGSTTPGSARPHPADVAFMQGMMLHHAQALEMTALVKGRTDNPTIARLAERIRASQVSEMSRMERWLEQRGEPIGVSAQAGHDAGHDPAQHAAMPGMISPDELQRLASATAAPFDRLFLEYMIRHHQGALTMVAELFATEGAGQEPELYLLASEVDADQRAEIDRMQRLLINLDPESP